LTARPSFATLTNSFQFNGKGNWSIDAVGSNNTPVGDLTAVVPVGSTVEKAFLYSSTFFTSPIPTVNFDGTSISTWTDLGFTAPCCGLKAFRADVTTQVAAKIGGGNALPFTFSILSESGSVDGEVLAIIYSNPTESERTIAFLDGNSAVGGDTTTVNLAQALTAADLADPGFEALLSLGIGFSTGGTQSSTVDINSTRLTSSAGGFDDGGLFNGGLITAGGIGDSTTNPAAPFSNVSPDDELYDLEPLLTAGTSMISIDTTNPSGDDNIFFAGINITAAAGVNQPPPPTGAVPEPISAIVWSLCIGSACLYCKRKRC
jgi:hypothetical protein